MIPMSTIMLFVIAAAVSLLVPAALLLLLGVKRRIEPAALLLGAASFLVSQLLLRAPLLQLLSGLEGFQSFAAAQPLLFSFLLALSAGIFEESARLGGGLILKKRLSFQVLLSFALGHAFCEVILIYAMTHVNNLLLCSMANWGMLTEAQEPQLALMLESLRKFDVPSLLAGLLERLSATFFHCFATFLVFYGVLSRRWFFYPLAILAHTLFNCITLLPLGMWPLELLLLLAATPCFILFLKKGKALFPAAADIRPAN